MHVFDAAAIVRKVDDRRPLTGHNAMDSASFSKIEKQVFSFRGRSLGGLDGHAGQLDSFVREVVGAPGRTDDRIDHVHPFENFSKRRVLSVQVRGIGNHNEKLRTR